MVGSFVIRQSKTILTETHEYTGDFREPQRRPKQKAATLEGA
jgi:hypothetical protein